MFIAKHKGTHIVNTYPPIPIISIHIKRPDSLEVIFRSSARNHTVLFISASSLNHECLNDWYVGGQMGEILEVDIRRNPNNIPMILKSKRVQRLLEQFRNHKVIP